MHAYGTDTFRAVNSVSILCMSIRVDLAGSKIAITSAKIAGF